MSEVSEASEDSRIFRRRSLIGSWGGRRLMAAFGGGGLCRFGTLSSSGSGSKMQFSSEENDKFESE